MSTGDAVAHKVKSRRYQRPKHAARRGGRQAGLRGIPVRARERRGGQAVREYIQDEREDTV